jgi:hypothetical protein
MTSIVRALIYQVNWGACVDYEKAPAVHVETGSFSDQSWVGPIFVLRVPRATRSVFHCSIGSRRNLLGISSSAQALVFPSAPDRRTRAAAT